MALMLAGGAGAGRLNVVCGPGNRPWVRVHGCVSRVGLESDAGSYLRLEYSGVGGWHPELAGWPSQTHWMSPANPGVPHCPP